MKKKYTFDETFFDKIDSEQKAYILGLLFADGYNHEGRGVVSLSLQEQDREILNKISLAMKNTKPLQFINMKRYHKGKAHQNQYRLNLCSRYFSHKLSTMGCYQCKSLSCKFPLVTPELLRHFIRGYFDGDGCVSYTNDRRNYPCGSISFVGSEFFSNALSKHLEVLEISAAVSYSNRYNKQIRRVAFGGRNQLIKFYEYIYTDATIYLERKKHKFDEFINVSQKHLIKNKSKNVYKSVGGCKLPFRVVKTLNYKTINLGTFGTREDAEKASLEWDNNHGRSVTLLY